MAYKDGLCSAHYTERNKVRIQERDNKWLYLYKDPQWDGSGGLREQQLRTEPLCRMCRAEHRLTPATVVHHVIAHQGNVELFYDADNLQSLCASCHSSITVKEDGGFGNPRK